MQMQLNIADGRCGYCGRGVHSRNAPHRWQGQWYCSLDCSHEAGDRTKCHKIGDCGCAAYSKVHRAMRGFLRVRARQRILLAVQRGRLTDEDFHMRLRDEDNLPYDPDDDMLLDFMERRGGGDDLDPDRAVREDALRRTIVADAAAEAASQSAMVDAVAVIALHNENKRRRLDNSSNLESMRLKLERKAMQYEDLMSDKLRSS